MNLVRADPVIQYVALSYIWGDSDGVCATSDNIAQIMEKNAFSSPAFNISKVISDAIQLVRHLGGKYLWVDRYCIPQDDNPLKQSQLEAMGSIFAGAWFTIIAAQNDVPIKGLCGTRNIFISAEHSNVAFNSEPETVFEVNGECLTNREVMMLNSWTLMCSRWYSRGWTFQEHLLSTRRIVFHNDTIGWECKLASWHESQDLSHLLPHGIPPDIIETKEPEVVKQSSWPDMYRYSRLVSMYNRRDLSYPEDVLNAFRGTFSLLSQSFDGVNISGLPETFFNATLLWQPWTPMIRRRAKLQRKGDAVLPSWSWIGWCGDIHSESWALAYTYLRSHRGQPSTPQDLYNWQVDPTVEWHYSSRLDDEHYRILDTSQDYRQLSDKPERLEELGWTRWMHSSGSTVYRHHSVPTQRFWYPIPIPPTPRVRSGLVSARFLHGKTRVATFGLGERFYSEVCDCDSVDLLSPTCEYEEGSEIRDQWAGFLRLNRVRNSKVRFRGSATTTTCDLVELSAGSFVENINGVELFEESQRPARPKDRRIYEFYNVLCVRWKEQPDTLSRVGYRRALGRVQKDAWDAVAKPANVTLG
jgi:hypothetical protein